MGNINSNSTTTSRLSNLTAVTKSASTLENKEDVTLIWLDRTIDITRTTLREITDYVLLYTEIEPCLAHIRSITTERIFLIVSGGYAEECLAQVHHLEQIDSVFIFCINLLKYKVQLIDSGRYPKIVDVFDNEDLLIRSIREEIDDLRKQISTFSLYKNQKSTRDLSKESASFLWFQLFKEILLRMPHSEASKREMIDQCRQYYRGNIEELRLIDDFALNYNSIDTIRWYTRQCFIYRLCNKALRTEDIELLYTFRYYIHDLCKRLAVEHQNFVAQRSQQPIVTLYRGLKLTKDEIARFQANVGSLISTNGFLSSSFNRDLALQFSLKTSKRLTDVFPTLFIIEADTRLKDVVFADISSFSEYVDEQEVLFDLDAAFKIQQVNFDDQLNIWIIHMCLTNEARQIVATYVEANRREMEKGNIFLIFGLLLTEMGHYYRAQVYFENLLDSNAVDDKPSLYTNIGRTKFLRGEYNQALKDFKVVYDLQRHQMPKNYVDLARTMNNLGLIYMEQGKHDLALDYHFDVVKIYKQHPGVVNELLLANSDNSIGVIFSHKHDYDRALKYLLRAKNLYEQFLPTSDHPTLATNYNSLGLAFYYKKQYDQALEFCLKALHIREKILPNNHPHIGDSCNNVALVYHKLNDYDRASNLFLRAIMIYENDEGRKMRIPICLDNMGLLCLDKGEYERAIDCHQQALQFYFSHKTNKYQNEIATTLNHLGIVYEMQSQFDQALEFYREALTIGGHDGETFVKIAMKIGTIYQKLGKYDLALDHYRQALKKTGSSSPETIATLLMAMGVIYHRQHNYDVALDLYKQVLPIRKQLLSSQSPELAWTLNNIGCVYDDMGDVVRALKYQKKAYHIRQKSLPPDHPDLATSLNNIGRVYQTLAHHHGGNLLESKQALANYSAALDIRRKSLPIDHPDLATSYYNLALIHADQREYEQAYIEVQKALEIQRKKLPPLHPDLLQTLALDKQLKLLLDYHHSK